MILKRQKLFAVFSMIGFVLLWAVLTDAWNYSSLISTAQHNIKLYKYLYSYLSRIVWTLPAIVLIFRFNKNLFWSKKQLFSKPKAEPVFAAFIAVISIYVFISMMIKYKAFHVTEENLLPLTVKFITVGFCEETVFRGFGYNLMKKVCSDTVSLIISALMFVLLHWPAYFIKLILYGSFDLSGFIAQSISAFFCGILFAIMLKRSGTIWNPIIAHFYYDLMLEVFV